MIDQKFYLIIFPILVRFMMKLVLKVKSAKILKSKFWSKSEQYSSGHNSRKPHKLFFGLIIILYVIILVENCRNLPRTIKIGAKKRFCWLRIFNRWFIWWWKAIDSKIRPELQSTQSGYFAGYCSFFFTWENQTFDYHVDNNLFKVLIYSQTAG